MILLLNLLANCPILLFNYMFVNILSKPVFNIPFKRVNKTFCFYLNNDKLIFAIL